MTGNSRLLTHYLGSDPAGSSSGWRGEVPTQGLLEKIAHDEEGRATYYGPSLLLQQGNANRVPRILSQEIVFILSVLHIFEECFIIIIISAPSYSISRVGYLFDCFYA